MTNLQFRQYPQQAAAGITYMDANTPQMIPQNMEVEEENIPEEEDVPEEEDPEEDKDDKEDSQDDD